MQNPQPVWMSCGASCATFAEYSKNVFRFKVREGRRFRFDKKLVGTGNNPFTISVECPHVGQDALKVSIHFEKFSLDEPGAGVNQQFCS
jgi:hypothetical protein